VVGISTLAMTTDDNVVLLVQSHRNTASPLLVAPAGSGSLEPRDITGTLADTVRTGVERELREETGLRQEEDHRLRTLDENAARSPSSSA
jgi:8-oxo-dGTP pyrophosphatase MutT (NUDIX family)